MIDEIEAIVLGVIFSRIRKDVVEGLDRPFIQQHLVMAITSFIFRPLSTNFRS